MMGGGTPDRGLRPHRRHPHRRPCRPRRIDRLAVPAPLRLDRLLRPPPRQDEPRVLAHRSGCKPCGGRAALATRRRYRGRHARARDRVRPAGGNRTDLDCMPVREDNPRSSAWSRLSGPGRHAHGPRDPLRVRAIVPWVRAVDSQLSAIAGPDGLALWTPVPHPRARACARSPSSRVRRGRADPVRAHVVPVPRASYRAPSTRAFAIARDRALVAGVVGAQQLRGASGATPWCARSSP